MTRREMFPMLAALTAWLFGRKTSTVKQIDLHDVVVTVWKDGNWRAWAPRDAFYARDDPDWLTEVPVATAVKMVIGDQSVRVPSGRKG